MPHLKQWLAALAAWVRRVWARLFAQRVPSLAGGDEPEAGPRGLPELPPDGGRLVTDDELAAWIGYSTAHSVQTARARERRNPVDRIPPWVDAPSGRVRAIGTRPEELRAWIARHTKGSPTWGDIPTNTNTSTMPEEANPMNDETAEQLMSVMQAHISSNYAAATEAREQAQGTAALTEAVARLAESNELLRAELAASREEHAELRAELRAATARPEAAA